MRVEAHDRRRLERLCRCITRPALSGERAQLNAGGQVELKLKTPWRDGTTHLAMSALEFMQRLAALVPRPRLHPISLVSAQLRCATWEDPRCANHGVLAPNAMLRPLVVPQRPAGQEGLTTVAESAAECEVETIPARPNRISWARLLRRVFDIDMGRCSNRGAGPPKVIAAVVERPVIENIPTHLGLDPQPPPRGRLREAVQDRRRLNTAWPVPAAIDTTSPLPRAAAPQRGWATLCAEWARRHRMSVDPEAGAAHQSWTGA